jgi:CHAD domain-containing protein
MKAAAPFCGASEPGSLGAGWLIRSLKQQWKRYRKQLKRCQRKCSTGAIHDFRVDTRRLLSMVELLGGFLPARRVEKVERLLKRHLDIFGELRDTQVQLAAVSGMLREFPEARPFQACLRAREKRCARRTRKNLQQVRSGRLGELIAECREEGRRQLEGTGAKKAFAVLLRAVDRAFRRTRQLRARIVARDTWTIHHTRVAFKRFRYMVEALAAHLPGVTGERLEAMRGYQTMMGEVQDAVVLLAALDKFLRKQAVEPEAAGRFRAELLRRRRRLIQAYLAAADQLLAFWPLPLPASNSHRANPEGD